MEFNEFAGTGVKIPAIIFGTSALGNLYTAISDQTKADIVKQAFEHCPVPVVFDSASKYGAGLALEKMGECLDKLNIAPEKVIISNKLGWRRTALRTAEPTFEPGVWKNLQFDAVQDISYEGIMRCFEEGNRLCGSKYPAQLASVHDPDEYLNAAVSSKDRDTRFTNIVEGYRALSDLRKNGKIKAIGIGAKNWRIIEEITAAVELDWVMLANSMTILRHPQELLTFMEKLQTQKISIINSAVFHAGFLTGGNYFDYKIVNNSENKALFGWREAFFTVCKKHNISPAQACVSFAMSAPGVISIALNTSKPASIKTNVQLVSTKVPAEFWWNMKQKGLISEEYNYI